MSDAEVLQVEQRKERGTLQARRLRASGKIPAILYGHGQDSLALTLVSEQLDAALRHGAHVVELKGDVSDNALLKEIQWDAFGANILHVDLTRVSATESVEITLAVELFGVAPGTRQGGIVEHLTHEIDIECQVTRIPEKIRININHLDIGDTILVNEIELPEGAKLLSNAEAVVVQCVEPTEMPEDEVAAAAGAEPEVIGRAEDEDGESD